MLDKLTDIAPLGTWALLLGASLLLLLGFVVYGHARLVNRAYGKPWRGPLAPTAYETSLRWTLALLAGGLLLWGATLGWPAGIMAVLGGLAAAALLAEGAARVLGR